MNADDFLPFENASDVFESSLDVTFRETNLAEALDIAELFAAFFEQDYRFGEAQLSLKKSGLVYDVHARLHGSVLELVLACHEQQGDCRSVKHLGKSCYICNSCDRHAIEFIPR